MSSSASGVGVVRRSSFWCGAICHGLPGILGIAAIAVLLVILPASKSHAASVYLADPNGETSITVGAGDYFDVYLWIADVTEFAGFECHITMSGPATMNGTASIGSWFGDGHTMMQSGGSSYHRSQVLQDPMDLTGSGDLAIFHLLATEEGTISISVTASTFVLGKTDSSEIQVDLPSTLYITVTSGDGDFVAGGGSTDDDESSSVSSADTSAVQNATPELDDPIQTVNLSVWAYHGTGAIAGVDVYVDSEHKGQTDSESALVIAVPSGVSFNLGVSLDVTVDLVDLNFHHWKIGESISPDYGRVYPLVRTLTSDTTAYVYYGVNVTVECGVDTIQDVITYEAVTGDTVVLENGTYTGTGNKNISLGDKELTITSLWQWPGCSTIDLTGQSARAFTLGSDQKQGTVIEWISITNGSVSDGGGAIRCEYGSSPIIRHNEITGNTSTNLGGAIYWSGGKITLVDNTFTDNSVGAGDHSGGAVFAVDGSAGAIHEIIDNRFIHNDGKGGHGGGFFFSTLAGSKIIVKHNTFVGNKANSGGAFNIESSYQNECPIEMTNNVIAHNTVQKYEQSLAKGGGVYVRYHKVIMVNNTIAHNTATGTDARGGGAMLEGSGSTSDNSIIRNCIFYGNTSAGTGPQLWLQSSPIAITYSDIEGGENDIEGSTNVTQYYANIDSDPRFVVPACTPPDYSQLDYHEKSEAGSFHSGSWTSDDQTSPCIDKGDPLDSYLNEPPPNGTVVNMGAYGNTAEASKSLGPDLSSFQITDQTTGSLVFTNSATVAVSITATPFSGRNISGYLVTETSQPPSLNDPGWQGSITTYIIQGASPANVTLYAWAKDDSDALGGIAGSIYFDSSTPQVTVWEIIANQDDTANVLWTTDRLAESSLKYGVVNMEGLTPYTANDDSGFSTEHFATTDTLISGANYKFVLVNNEVAASPVYWPSMWPIEGDCTRDCRVNILDLIFIRNRLNQPVTVGDNIFADLTKDTKINILDLIAARNKLNTQCP